jgi:hypothetical protein
MSRDEDGWDCSPPPDSEIGAMHELYVMGSSVVAEYGKLNREQWCNSSGLYNWHAAKAVAAYGDLGVKAWRPASAAPAKGEDKPKRDHCSRLCGYCVICTGEFPESDSAWLKRTVEELTTARPVEVTWNDGMHRLEAPGFEPLLILHAVQQRRTDWIVDILTSNNWPLRTKAEAARAAEPSPQPDIEANRVLDSVERLADKLHASWGSRRCGICRGRGIVAGPGEYTSEDCGTCKGTGVRPEPSPQPGGFLDALTGRVTELERRMTRRQKQAQETNDRLARLERDSHAPVDFTTAFQRLDELELQARVARRARLESGGHETAAELLARIEREERERKP